MAGKRRQRNNKKSVITWELVGACLKGIRGGPYHQLKAGQGLHRHPEGCTIKGIFWP